jgi:restriction endonuclease Mrr
MKIQGTCADATDLREEILECIQLAGSGQRPTFTSDLQARLVRETLDELRSGRMDERAFERLIRDVVKKIGAVEARVVDDRRKDEGADIVATFVVAGVVRQSVAIQAKYYKPQPPVGPEVVEQLIKGIEAESADLGMVVTSGTISELAKSTAEKYYEDQGIRIVLLDGEDFAKLIVESGIQEERNNLTLVTHA